jgi:hypothetical protein
VGEFGKGAGAVVNERLSGRRMWCVVMMSRQGGCAEAEKPGRCEAGGSPGELVRRGRLNG